MKATIYISLKEGVLDPQGLAIKGALASLDFSEVKSARQGKVIELELADISHDEATKRVTEMCERLLANTVIENYRFDLD